MNIALLIENAFSNAGTENICNFMCEVYSKNNAVDVLSLTGKGAAFYPYHGARTFYSAANESQPRRALFKKIATEKYDYVFVIGMGRLSVEFAILAKFFLDKNSRRKTKFIACEHVAFESFTKIKQFIKVIILPFYHQVVVLTKRDASHLSQYHDQVIEIPNPVFFKNNQIDNQNKIAIAVGRLTQQKDFDRLINIWRQFSSQNSQWVLFIIGSGELENELKNQAIDLINQGKLIFTGQQSKLDEFYKKASIILMTSNYEGLPMVLLEAKAWSLPAIAYNCPTGPSEIIADKIDGFLIQNNDQEKFVEKLNIIANHPEILHHLRENIAETHKKFDPEKITALWLQIINENSI